MKKCPYCAEEIKAEAIKCKHCGSMLNEAQRPTIQIDNPKKGKILQIAGGIIFLLFGGYLIFLIVDGQLYIIRELNPNLFYFLVSGVIIGLILFYSGRIINWWHWK